MKSRLFLSLICGLFLTGCAASVKSNFQNAHPVLESDSPIAFLDVMHQVPEGAVKIGDAKFGDTGFSTQCNFNSNLIKAGEIAKQNGANIVKVVSSKGPDLWSSCYRMKIDYYSYNGNLETLKQYKLPQKK